MRDGTQTCLHVPDSSEGSAGAAGAVHPRSGGHPVVIQRFALQRVQWKRCKHARCCVSHLMSLFSQVHRASQKSTAELFIPKSQFQLASTTDRLEYLKTRNLTPTDRRDRNGCPRHHALADQHSQTPRLCHALRRQTRLWEILTSNHTLVNSWRPSGASRSRSRATHVDGRTCECGDEVFRRCDAIRDKTWSET